MRDLCERSEDEKLLTIPLKLYSLKPFVIIEPKYSSDFRMLIFVQISYSFCRVHTYLSGELF